MARDEPLLPNAGIVARREYVDRVRSPLFRISTLVLMALAVGVALTPIVIRYLDRSTVDRIAIIADEERLAVGTMAAADGIMNVPPPGVAAGEWTPPYRIERATDRDLAIQQLAAGRLDGIIEVVRLADDSLDVTYHTAGPPDGVRSQLAGFTALSVAILDWTSSLPRGLDGSATSERRPSTRRRSADRPRAAARSMPWSSPVVPSSGRSSSSSCSSRS